MRNRQVDPAEERRWLHCKTREYIDRYREKSPELKLQWLETQRESFCRTMPDRVKEIRDRLKRGEI